MALGIFFSKAKLLDNCADDCTDGGGHPYLWINLFKADAKDIVKL